MGAVEHLKTLCCLRLPPESAMIAVVPLLHEIVPHGSSRFCLFGPDVAITSIYAENSETLPVFRERFIEFMDRRLRTGAPRQSRIPPFSTSIPAGAQPRTGHPQLLGNLAQRPAGADNTSISRSPLTSKTVAEEAAKRPSRRMRRAAPSRFETGPLNPPQHDGLGSVYPFNSGSYLPSRSRATSALILCATPASISAARIRARAR
jgi:hypothetical protein